MDPCVGVVWEYSWIFFLWLEWLFDGYIVNAGTSWSSAYLQVYKRASSWAWTRQQYAPFKVRVFNCTWTVAHDTFIVFRLFSVDSGPFAPSQHSTGERESATLTHWAVVFAGLWLLKLSLVLALRSLCHHMEVIICSINCCSSVL